MEGEPKEVDVETKRHWEEVYTGKPASEVSWFQEHSGLSLRFIHGTGVAPTGGIIDGRGRGFYPGGRSARTAV